MKMMIIGGNFYVVLEGTTLYTKPLCATVDFPFEDGMLWDMPLTEGDELIEVTAVEEEDAGILVLINKHFGTNFKFEDFAGR